MVLTICFVFLQESNKVEKPKDDSSYGATCEQPDLEPDVYERERTRHFDLLLENQTNRFHIEAITREQSKCEKWIEVRRNLITASNFGLICCHRKNSSYKNKIKTILYPPILNTLAIQHGNLNEKTAISQLEIQMGIKINQCGIFIDSEYPYLAASPDGVYDTNGLVEIKCPYSAKGLCVDAAIYEGKLKYFKVDKKTKAITLNQKHKYYFQIQGQLHIADKENCLFAVWTSSDLPLKVVIVKRDDQFWMKNMFPFLDSFYNKRLVLEIVDPRKIRNMDIRNGDDEIPMVVQE